MAVVFPKTRTRAQVEQSLKDCRKHGDAGADVKMARLFVKFGNITPDAREFARRYLAEQEESESK